MANGMFVKQNWSVSTALEAVAGQTDQGLHSGETLSPRIKQASGKNKLLTHQMLEQQAVAMWEVVDEGSTRNTRSA